MSLFKTIGIAIFVVICFSFSTRMLITWVTHERATAEITSVSRDVRLRGPDSYTYEIQYLINEDTVQGSIESLQLYSVDDEIAITYDKDDPSDIAVAINTRDFILRIVLPVGFGLGAIIYYVKNK